MPRPTLQDESLALLDELVERHGPTTAARLYVETITAAEARALAAPFALVLARRADHNDLRRFLDEN